MATNDRDIKALLDTRADACQERDIDRLMSIYSSDIVYYDAVPPIQFVGSDDVRSNFLRFFEGYDGPISVQADDITVAISGDVAFAHMIQQATGEREDGLADSIKVRSTVCCRRSGDSWLITHEHVSMPISTGGAG